MTDPLVLDLAQVRMTDVAAVGGKSASLGEMISQLTARGVRVPGGFATTAHAYRIFLSQNGLDARIEKRLATLDAEDVKALAAAGSEIRGWMLAQPFSAIQVSRLTTPEAMFSAPSACPWTIMARVGATQSPLGPPPATDTKLWTVSPRAQATWFAIQPPQLKPTT